MDNGLLNNFLFKGETKLLENLCAIHLFKRYSNTDGITAIELAKLVNLPVDIVKKKLQILKDKNIVRVKGMNPKFWKFDEYNFQRLDDDDEIFHLLCNFEDVDFDRYFKY